MNRLLPYFSRQAWRQRHLRRTLARLGAGPGAATLSLGGLAPHFEVRGRIELGAYVTFRGQLRRTSIFVAAGACLKIGDHAFINQGGNLAVTCGLTLGHHCLVGEAVSFFDTNYHEVDQDAGVLSAPIIIGDNVWIGHGAILLPGAQVGDHSVIAAGSVVRGGFPARCLVAGVPARFVRPIRCRDDFFRS